MGLLQAPYLIFCIGRFAVPLLMVVFRDFSPVLTDGYPFPSPLPSFSSPPFSRHFLSVFFPFRRCYTPPLRHFPFFLEATMKTLFAVASLFFSLALSSHFPAKYRSS